MKGDFALQKIDIKSLTLDELTKEIVNMGHKTYRAKQIFSWLHKEGATSFDEMSNVSKELRNLLEDRYYIANAEVELKRKSALDDTAKYLLRLNDGEYIESVLMKYNHGYSICISTQVGCKMNCSFCATGKGGFIRNLTASEMLSQIQVVSKDIGERISNVVMMGMGEPLDNYDNVLRFLDLVSDDDGLNIGMRHITLSTCGIVDKIYDLADKKLQITLSVSLHAPNDNIRNQTMPVNKKWNIEELLQGCKYYSEKTNRRISFEYAIIGGVNDSVKDAKELSDRIKGIHAHVNLIPVNDVTGNNYIKSDKKSIRDFMNVLEKTGISTTLRRTLGSDIEASCGQLRGKLQEGVNISED